ncbi:hypothetical protein KAW80_00220 [Candidatus Babeliales bacterium]|nr:hypothetical protein [Candidatus Babeliales bacterium]
MQSFIKKILKNIILFIFYAVVSLGLISFLVSSYYNFFPYQSSVIGINHANDCFGEMPLQRDKLDKELIEELFSILAKNKKDWICYNNPDKKQRYFYNSKFPEFTIQIPYSETSVYLEDSNKQAIYLTYNGTIIKTLYGVWYGRRVQHLRIVPEKWCEKKSKQYYNQHNTGAYGYGAISKVTGRPRTNYVSGYYRGGTWVQPYYRS